MKSAYDVLVQPVYTEKSVGLASEGKYTFIVRSEATKPEIRDAVENAFGVQVARVNTLNRKGKRKRDRKRWRVFGSRPDTKRAVVTLREGDKIELFEV